MREKIAVKEKELSNKDKIIMELKHKILTLETENKNLKRNCKIILIILNCCLYFIFSNELNKPMNQIIISTLMEILY